MRELPVIFNDEMVRAILDGSKTQTRRPIVPQPGCDIDNLGDGSSIVDAATGRVAPCPLGEPGNVLWVREAWASSAPGIVAYRADGQVGAWMGDGGGGRLWVHHGWIVGAPHRRDGAWYGLGKVGGRWRPSIHMPRWASRLTLRVTDVRVERVQDITEEDAIAEGIALPANGVYYGDEPHRDIPNLGIRAFAALWDSIYAPRGLGWDANPWVWSVTFEPVEVER